MPRTPISSLAVITLVVSLTLSAPASAAVTSFTATLRSFVGSGSGLPASPTPTPSTGCPALACTTASGHLASYSSSSFSLGSGVFVVNQFNASATNQGGTVPLPTQPSGLYVLGTIVNQVSGGGTISSGGGPSGGYGGALGSGTNLAILIGFSPLPNVFGFISVPLNAGVTSTATGMSNVLGNPVTVTVSGSAWTTGTITYDDAKLGTTTGGSTMDPIRNPFATVGTAMGTRSLTASGGQITLVAPVTIRIFDSNSGKGSVTDLRAGYQALTLTFVPEAGTVLLLAGAAGLVAAGRRRR